MHQAHDVTDVPFIDAVAGVGCHCFEAVDDHKINRFLCQLLLQPDQVVNVEVPSSSAGRFIRRAVNKPLKEFSTVLLKQSHLVEIHLENAFIGSARVRPDVEDLAFGWLDALNISNPAAIDESLEAKRDSKVLPVPASPYSTWSLFLMRKSSIRCSLARWRFFNNSRPDLASMAEPLVFFKSDPGRHNRNEDPGVDVFSTDAQLV